MGGSAVPEGLLDELVERLPNVKISNVWGLTEATSIATLTSGDDYIAHPTSAGQPVADVDVWISIEGKAPRDVRDTVGELCIRGPIVAGGYWDNAAATEATFIDGWLRTGDVGLVDGDGHVFVLDRLKDMIIRGGENIYSLEVENALITHPSVGEVAVVGLPDDVMGEIVAAVVVPTPGTAPTPEELRSHVSSTLADYKRPAVYEFVSELPRNASGKLLKRELRAVVTTAPRGRA
jgi:fatty-acyl-CoA synthase